MLERLRHTTRGIVRCKVSIIVEIKRISGVERRMTFDADIASIREKRIDNY